MIYIVLQVNYNVFLSVFVLYFYINYLLSVLKKILVLHGMLQTTNFAILKFTSIGLNMLSIQCSDPCVTSLPKWTCNWANTYFLSFGLPGTLHKIILSLLFCVGTTLNSGAWPVTWNISQINQNIGTVYFLESQIKIICFASSYFCYDFYYKVSAGIPQKRKWSCLILLFALFKTFTVPYASMQYTITML